MVFPALADGFSHRGTFLAGRYGDGATLGGSDNLLSCQR